MWARSRGIPHRTLAFLLATTACGSSERGSSGSGGDGGSGNAATGGSSSGTAGGAARGGSAGSATSGGSAGTGASASGGGAGTGASASGGSNASGGMGNTGGSAGTRTCPEREPRGEPPSFTLLPCGVGDTTLACDYDTMPDAGLTCRTTYRCQCVSNHMGGADCYWGPSMTLCPDGGM